MTKPLGIQNPLLPSTPLGPGHYRPNLKFLVPLGRQSLNSLNPSLFQQSLVSPQLESHSLLTSSSLAESAFADQSLGDLSEQAQLDDRVPIQSTEPQPNDGTPASTNLTDISNSLIQRREVDLTSEPLENTNRSPLQPTSLLPTETASTQGKQTHTGLPITAPSGQTERIAFAHEEVAHEEVAHEEADTDNEETLSASASINPSTSFPVPEIKTESTSNIVPKKISSTPSQITSSEPQTVQQRSQSTSESTRLEPATLSPTETSSNTDTDIDAGTTVDTDTVTDTDIDVSSPQSFAKPLSDAVDVAEDGIEASASPSNSVIQSETPSAAAQKVQRQAEKVTMWPESAANETSENELAGVELTGPNQQPALEGNTRSSALPVDNPVQAKSELPNAHAQTPIQAASSFETAPEAIAATVSNPEFEELPNTSSAGTSNQLRLRPEASVPDSSKAVSTSLKPAENQQQVAPEAIAEITSDNGPQSTPSNHSNNLLSSPKNSTSNTSKTPPTLSGPEIIQRKDTSAIVSETKFPIPSESDRSPSGAKRVEARLDSLESSSLQPFQESSQKGDQPKAENFGGGRIQASGVRSQESEASVIVTPDSPPTQDFATSTSTSQESSQETSKELSDEVSLNFPALPQVLKPISPLQTLGHKVLRRKSLGETVVLPKTEDLSKVLLPKEQYHPSAQPSDKTILPSYLGQNGVILNLQDAENSLNSDAFSESLASPVQKQSIVSENNQADPISNDSQIINHSAIDKGWRNIAELSSLMAEDNSSIAENNSSIAENNSLAKPVSFQLSRTVNSVSTMMPKEIDTQQSFAQQFVAIASPLTPHPFPDLHPLQPPLQPPNHSPQKNQRKPVAEMTDVPPSQSSLPNSTTAPSSTEGTTASPAEVDKLANHIYQLVRQRLTSAQERRGFYTRRLG
ncbi:MAG: hypothetical protein AAFY20_07585 [Cyanobacteria bacterium J06639_14]